MIPKVIYHLVIAPLSQPEAFGAISGGSPKKFPILAGITHIFILGQKNVPMFVTFLQILIGMEAHEDYDMEVNIDQERKEFLTISNHGIIHF